MPAADSKPDEALDMFGYFPCSQRPGAWMGAAYMFFNALEKENDKKASHLQHALQHRLLPVTGLGLDPEV